MIDITDIVGAKVRAIQGNSLTWALLTLTTSQKRLLDFALTLIYPSQAISRYIYFKAVGTYVWFTQMTKKCSYSNTRPRSKLEFTKREHHVLQRRGERRATINEFLCGLRRLRIYVL